MKTAGAILEFTRERNDDIMRVYRQELKQTLDLNGMVYMPTLLNRVANSQASRFWVSEERATAVISLMLRGRQVKGLRPTKKAMFDEIFRRVRIILGDDVDIKTLPPLTLRNIVREVIEQKAPSFYLTGRTIGEIVYRVKKGWYD